MTRTTLLLTGHENAQQQSLYTAVNFKLMATEYLADVLSYIPDDKHLPIKLLLWEQSFNVDFL